MDFPEAPDEKSGEEEFPPIADSDNDDGGSASEVPPSCPAISPTRAPKRKPSGGQPRGGGGICRDAGGGGGGGGGAGGGCSDLELDTGRLNAYARASLAVLAGEPTFRRLMPRGKKMRRNAIHVSEKAIMNGMAEAVDSELGIGEPRGGSGSSNTAPAATVTRTTGPWTSRRGSALAGGPAGVFSGTSADAGRMPVLSAAAAHGARPLVKVVLYLDLNETVLISDKAGGGDIGHGINKALSRRAFVRRASVRAGPDGIRWHNGMSFSEAAAAQRAADAARSSGDAPADAGGADAGAAARADDGPPTLVVPLLDAEAVDPAELVSCWDARGSAGTFDAFPVRLSTFTDSDADPGRIYRSEYERLLGRLRWSFHGCTEPVRAALTDATGEHHFVLPSFFHSLCRLAAAARDSQRGRSSGGGGGGGEGDDGDGDGDGDEDVGVAWDFRPVFRTFGTDLPKVVAAMRLFSRGEHPGFYPADTPGALPHPSFRRCGLTRAELPRFEFGEHDAAWYCHRGGTAAPPGSVARSGERDMARASPVLRRYSSVPEDARRPPTAATALEVLRDDAAIFRMLVGGRDDDGPGGPSNTPVGVRDDYFAWHASGYARDAGKPAWFDSQTASPVAVDTYSAQVVSVFFDDHIREDSEDAHLTACVARRDCSIDPAAAAGGGSRSVGRAAAARALCHLIRTDLVLAVEDDLYFCHGVLRCLRTAQAFLRREVESVAAADAAAAAAAAAAPQPEVLRWAVAGGAY